MLPVNGAKTELKYSNIDVTRTIILAKTTKAYEVLKPCKLLQKHKI